ENMRVRNVTVALLVFALGLLTPALAQERFGGLAGTVMDPSNLPVPGATVTVTNKATSALRTTVTRTDGGWDLPNLEPGRYSIAIELSGFQKVTADDVLVLLGRTTNLPSTLQVGSVSETVQVTAQAAKQIDLTSTTLAHNVTSE